eukprot:jgi/Bigna1/130599/aug1.11_g5307
MMSKVLFTCAAAAVVVGAVPGRISPKATTSAATSGAVGTSFRMPASHRRVLSGLNTKTAYDQLANANSGTTTRGVQPVSSTMAQDASIGQPSMSLLSRLKAFRRNNRDVLSEFLGTFTLMFLGTAVNCVAAMGQTNLVGVAIGWMFSIAMAVYVAGGVGGAHLNPSVTFAFALLKGFPWKMVIPYTIAQFLGAFAGSGLAYLDHKSGLDAMDAANGVIKATSGVGATAGIFATYPASHVGVLHAFGDEVLTTAALLMCVFAVSDNKNIAPKGNLGPVIIGGLVALLILGFGGITGVAMNPARDLAPRIMTFLAGWGSEVFTAGNNYWWIPIVAPMIGAPLGGAVYNAFIDPPKENEQQQVAAE